MTCQTTFEVRTHGRGMIDISAKVAGVVHSAGSARGIVHVFVQHTSCSVLITENADAAVQRDLEVLARRWAPDGDSAYRHDAEGEDDMAAHARSLLAGVSVTVPFADGKLLLGTWQGIYLWEHRTHPHTRSVCVTIIA